MTKVSKKSEKITAFGGIFFVLDIFDRILSSVIDSHLGLRSKLIGYQYSEIIRAVFSVFCCGGDLARLRHIIASTAVFTCNNDGIMEIISLPPFSPLNRGTEGVSFDLRPSTPSFPLNRGTEGVLVFLLIHNREVIHNTHQLSTICNEQRVNLVIAEHLLNRCQLCFWRNRLWCGSHHLTD